MTYQIISSPNAITKLKLTPSAEDNLSVSGIAIAPHRLGALDCCDFAGDCVKFCVGQHTGRNRMDSIRKAQLRRKRLLFTDPDQFKKLVRADVNRFLNWSAKKKLEPFFRPHLYSDTPKNPKRNKSSSVLDYRWLAREFPNMELYGYTKNPFCFRWKYPQNYSITYSVSEKSKTQTIKAFLNRGINCAMVVDTHYNGQRREYGTLPKTLMIGSKRFKCIDGDRHDYRHPRFDGKGNLVLLRFKGSSAKKIQAIKSGFCKEVN